MLKECLMKKLGLVSAIQRSIKNKNIELFKYNSRLVPDHLQPKCEKRNIYVQKTEGGRKTVKVFLVEGFYY